MSTKLFNLNWGFGAMLLLILGCISGCNDSTTTFTIPPHIVFTSDRDGQSQVYIMNADGSAQRRLTDNTASDDQGSISAAGLAIAYRSKTGFNNSQIFKVNNDGSNPVQISHFTGGSNGGRWGPNARLVFSSRGDDQKGPNVYSMRSDGTDLTRLTNGPSPDLSPSYSPDAKKIVFASGRMGVLNICIMNADGTQVLVLTNTDAVNDAPSFSPDGKKIAFFSQRDGHPQIYIMNADGSAQTNISNSASSDLNPQYSPNSNEIVFSSSRTGRSQLYIMKDDGSNVRRITNNNNNDTEPDWR